LVDHAFEDAQLEKKSEREKEREREREREKERERHNASKPSTKIRRKYHQVSAILDEIFQVEVLKIGSATK